jgi:phosphoglycerate kinase
MSEPVAKSSVAKPGLDKIRFIEELNIKEKRVFIRLDLNVPLKNGKILDETRITAALPTIKYALEQKSKIILCSHLGRPKKPEDRKTMSLEPVGDRISELLGVDVHLVEDPQSDAPKALLGGWKANQLILLENIRFDEGEEENSEKLAAKLARFVDVYINDAFGASHRAHSTIVALPKLIKERGLGYLMKKEVEMLDKILFEPKRPFVALLGGAKVSDKIGVIDHLMDTIDVFLIGGAMAYTFMKAQNVPVGASRIEKDKVTLARDLIARLEARNKKILIPTDHVVAKKLEANAESKTVTFVTDDWMGVDIGPATTEAFINEIKKAGTVFWNGPMGVFEIPPFNKGSFAIAEALGNSDVVSIVGGGDSAAAVNASGFGEKMTHISTGGGASLEYLQGDKLPGLEALRPDIRGQF